MAQGCTLILGQVLQGGDCDDTKELIHPAMIEICDNLDNDCDDSIDEELIETWYLDFDEDGFGDAASEQTSCVVPDGRIEQSGDCDDQNVFINPTT